MVESTLAILLYALLGILVGAIANALADCFSHGRVACLPRYPDGSRRPFLAWTGITAFVFNLRAAQGPQAKSIGTGQSRGVTEKPELLSWRHPFAEIAAAALMLLFIIDSGSLTMRFASLVWLLHAGMVILIAIVDIEHRRIPLALLVPLGLLALFDASIMPDPASKLLDTIVGGLLGFVVGYLMYAGGYLYLRLRRWTSAGRRNTRAFGFGDVMLMSVIGLIVGFPEALLAIFVGLCAAAVGAILALIQHIRKQKTYHAALAIPLGPYLLAGAITVQLYGDELWMLARGG